MSANIPTVTDFAWPINGRHRFDYGGENVTHFCTFLTGGNCTLATTTDFTECKTRCFGYGFLSSATHETVRPPSVDFYSIMDGFWQGSPLSDSWRYPSNCKELIQAGESCTYSKGNSSSALNLAVVPSFNPQGFTFTVAGSGEPGFQDGYMTLAKFNSPHDVAVDDLGVIYVADTLNNAIRMISLQGYVSTIAGQGPKHPGYADGPCVNATFTQPKGLDVRINITDATKVVSLVVADTGNHRIRQIVYNTDSEECIVTCLTGLCGNNTLSATLYKTKASPNSGYADGVGDIARFSAPEGITFLEDSSMVVADTGNFLLRYVLPNGNTSTLAGNIGNGPSENGNPLPGCPPPCLEGVPGYRDGNLSFAQFYNLLDVTRGANNTVWVVDENRVRLIEFPYVNTTYYTVSSTGRVSTIAGTVFRGDDDGIGQYSSFSDPSGLFITSDNVVYVADSGSCRIRRVSPVSTIAEEITCSTTGIDIIRPSGCTSYDQTVNKFGEKISRVESNIQYNYGYPFLNDRNRGKYIKNCVGTPPYDLLDKRYLNVSGDNLVIDDGYIRVNEDSEEGMAVIVHCPSFCGTDQNIRDNLIEGNQYYSESSSICLSAIHDGIISNDTGGYLQVIFNRYDYLNFVVNSTIKELYSTGHSRNKLSSSDIPNESFTSLNKRIFHMETFYQHITIVHSISGHPNAPLEDGCGYSDNQPASKAYYNSPSGIAAIYNASLSDHVFLYIADSMNHRIRGLSAVCTQICENQGRCVGNDKCECKSGWSGRDCTIPSCDRVFLSNGVYSNGCPDNHVCVGPNLCSCKPGNNYLIHRSDKFFYTLMSINDAVCSISSFPFP